jgi:hypothetical protein
LRQLLRYPAVGSLLLPRQGCSADRPATKLPKPVSTLSPRMSAVLIWPISSNVARALFPNSLVIGEHAQDLLVRPLVHASWLDRHGTVSAPLKSGA